MGRLAVLLMRLLLLLCLALASCCWAISLPSSYVPRQNVPVYANKVGPFSNPSETYEYYDMPFCRPPELKYMGQDIGQMLRGDRFVNTLYEVSFKSNTKNRLLCRATLSPGDIKKLRQAIDQDYYFELIADDLPLLGFIGEKEKLEDFQMSHAAEEQYFLFTHLDLEFHHDDDFNIVEANVTADPRFRQELTLGSATELSFTYSVTWKETDRHHSHRVEKYSMSGFRQKHIQIHWISIMNSCILVVMLTGFLGLILLRVLRNDIARSIELDGDELELLDGQREDDCGWKKISGDVFRLPSYPLLLSSLLGMGAQMLILVTSMISLTTLGFVYPHSRGAMHYFFIVVFVFTAAVAGFMSAYTFKMIGGDQERKWVWNVLLSGCLFPVPFFSVAMFNNTVAWGHGTTQALPVFTMMQVFFMWALLCMPFTVIGGFIGRRCSSPLDPPCRTTKVPREIPSVTCLRTAPVQLAIAGFLPFSAIYIELHYIFASVWGFKLYTLYSVLLLIFVILLVVVSFLTIALIYFQLAAEDHRWWWRSFFSGVAPGIFVYAYCFVYFFRRSSMNGVHQASFFFGYMAMACYAFSAMLGAVSFFSSFLFVSYIYRAIKSD